MRFRAQAVSLEIESMRDCRASPEIELMPVFPVSRAIVWMRVYRASLEIESMLVCPDSRGIGWTRVYRGNPEIESMPACLGSLETALMLDGRGSQTSVDQGVLATTYKIFQAELPTEASGRIGAKRIWATFETIGKTIGAMFVIGMAIVGGITITLIIRTIQDSVSGQARRGRDSPTGAITAGRNLSTTATETTFITTMARCITETSRCARKPNTFSKLRRSR
jgi:hypothetical protein